jgi:hypothetical protein
LQEDLTLSENAPPFLQHPPPHCIAFSNPYFIVVDARAILAIGSG